MPLEPFAIFQITEAMILQDEPMGSKDKVWCQLPAELGNGHWLFKQPRQQEANIEHLAEKIAHEMAALIQLPCARIELAEFEGLRGSISLDVRSPGDVLVHGNEIIAGRVLGYDLHQRRHTSDHTFERIRQAILEVCGGRCKEDLGQFAGYLVFDALIGNTDRHHENWALLKREAGPTDHRLAPSFDHASSLGREMRDERRLRLIRENKIPEYLRKGWGAIYLEELGETEISPIELVNRLAARMPESFGPWLKRVEGVTDQAIMYIVERIPAGWISPAQRELATALIREARDQLTRIKIVMKTLFVAWKDTRSAGGWFPVGRLDADVAAERYEFRYLQGALEAAKERGFAPFDSFPDFRKEYVSGELFPFFANRVQNSNRPSIREYLHRLDLDRGQGVPFDPIEVLGVSEGRRATDSLEIFPRVERNESRLFAIKFFLHGWRHIHQQAAARILRLAPGEDLSVALEVTNPATAAAVQLQTRDRILIGWAPRYLMDDLIKVIISCPVAAKVSRVNLPPAPPSQRVLVLFEGCWPEGYEPMNGQQFQPFVTTPEPALAQAS